MSIREDIENQYKKSIKEKNIDQTNTLRLVKSAIKDKDIAVRSDGVKNGISDQEILSLFQNLIKQRKDSIESFKTANRKDLIEKEKIEIEIINSFLPNQKNEKETEEAILGIIEKEQLSSLKDMGKLMNLLKNTYAGQIDMSLAGKIAKANLTNK